MRHKRILITFILFLIFSTACAKAYWHTEVGISYVTKDVTQLNDFLQEIRPDEYKVVDEFACLPSIEFRFIKNTNGSLSGLVCGYNTSGGRIDYRDYSGKHSIDPIVNQFQFGVFLEDRLSPITPNDLRYYIKLSASYSVLKIKSKIVIYNIDSAVETDYFNSWGIIASPGLSYPIIKKPYSLKIELGGQLSISQAFHLDNRLNAYIKINDKKLVPQYYGFYMGLVLSFNKRI